MRLPIPLFLSLLLLGSCLPDELEAAISLEVTYSARPGCITVMARDAKEPHGEASIDVNGGKLDNMPVRIAVFRQESWSHTLEIVTTAHEQSCEGRMVARDEREIRLSSAGVESIPVTLEVTDEDGDGYMPVSLDGTLGGTDCDDGHEDTHPNATEACDSQDNNCDGSVDEDVIPSWYLDGDGDGSGDMQGSPYMGCSAPPGPSAYVQNAMDCDDLDPHNRGGGTEVCDDRDNTCDGQRDENDVCGGKGWAQVNDPALTGDNRDWRTVALGRGGRPIWVAGLNGVLAWSFTGESFAAPPVTCGAHNWRAAWVRPSDGHVFLAGEGGFLAEHDGANCSNAEQVASRNNLTGLVGFESNGTTLIYVADNQGRLYAWRPGHSLNEHYNTAPPRYFGIHGLQSGLLLIVGGTGTVPQSPLIVSYPGSGGASAVKPHFLSGVSPPDYSGAVRAVWMAHPSLAYAVGDNGLVMSWDGAVNWSRVNPSATEQATDFTSVVVLDSSSVYVTGITGTIRRLTASGLADHPSYSADRPLRDIALSSPGDIWAVGDDGRVIHFPQ